MHALSSNFIILVPRFESIVQSSDKTLIYSNKGQYSIKNAIIKLFRWVKTVIAATIMAFFVAIYFYYFIFFSPSHNKDDKTFKFPFDNAYCSVPMTSVAIKGGERKVSFPSLIFHCIRLSH